MEKKQMTFIKACVDFFGLKEGQGLKEFFQKEIKPLTDADRIEIGKGLEANGYEIVGGMTASDVKVAA
jgi:hypothetical protein